MDQNQGLIFITAEIKRCNLAVNGHQEMKSHRKKGLPFEKADQI